MSQSFSSRKIIRKNFGTIDEILELDDLISLQIKSFEQFLQFNTSHDKRVKIGLQAVLSSVFPISDTSGRAQLDFCHYNFDEPNYNEFECKEKGLTYSAPLRGQFRLIVWDVDPDTDAKSIKDIKEQEVYIGDIPLMTARGTFVINGIERVVVSQIHRSPGVFFDIDQTKITFSGKPAYLARIVPYRGSWVDFEFDAKDILNVKIDRRKKVSLAAFLMALPSQETEEAQKTNEKLTRKQKTGMSKQEIFENFYEFIELKKSNNGWTLNFNEKHWENTTLSYNLIDNETMEVVAEEGAKLTPRNIKKLISSGLKTVFLSFENLIGHYIAEEKIDEESGLVILSSGDLIDEGLKEKLERFETIKLIHINYLNTSDAIVKTINESGIHSQDDALIEIYKTIRPGEPPTPEGGEILFKTLFFDENRYVLSSVGRAKINERFGFDESNDLQHLSKKDILSVLKELNFLRENNGTVDDIDNLGNRRIRSVGELVGNQLHLGIVRMERTIREKINAGDIEVLMPHDLIHSKPISASIREFFGSSQLSQFMDQTNPLSEITHKRRLSSLGPGGLSRDRAGFEVRDVHPTHYGRICPIETPEGQNVGLINSLSTYARMNQYGFIESPYRVVKDAQITEEIIWISATQEKNHVIAQVTARIDKDKKFIDDFLPCRHDGEFLMQHRNDVTLIDLSAKQMVSIAASLIPFLEKDDASRALMGSNMQRQAVPLLKTDSPIIATGIEGKIAKDSGAVIIAKRAGIVDQVDGKKIVIRALDEENKLIDVDIYNLIKFQGSNMNTCLNQKPLVRIGEKVFAGDVIADGASIDRGELALGRNILVGFMSYQGYNFEDSIVISEKIVQEDVFTSVHVEEFEVLARDTKLGNEEITRDIPNISEEALCHLDETGIAYIGADVKSGDIIVGKVTPKGEKPVTPEEKLLRAIFGEKASNVKDSSLRVPPGVFGKVVDVQILSRRGVDKDSRSLSIENQKINEINKNKNAEINIIKKNFMNQIRENLLNEKVKKAPSDYEKTPQITEDYLDNIPQKLWSHIIVENKDKAEKISNIYQQLEEHLLKIQQSFENSVEKMQRGDELPSGVLKLVRVSIAIKRKLQPGDKMAGRHGNKGVVSKVVPVEDMPHLEDGTPLEMILNPLGLPSRMNLGQILETHLGYAACGYGQKIKKTLKEFKEGKKSVIDVRECLSYCYGNDKYIQLINEKNDEEIIEMATHLQKGIPMETPVFDGASLEEIEEELERAGCNKSGQVYLYDGRNGERLDRPVTVGYLYMLKLHHLVDDKIHARSIGPYSLVTQQPLGGKAQFGGQRFGEMEVWALEAYGASYTLQEMLTVKSDDVIGRTKAYKSIVKGDGATEAGLPESFLVLVKELKSLLLSLKLN